MLSLNVTKFLTKFSENFLICLLALSLFSYSLLSYLLLFRDKRAIAAIGNFYPQLSDFLHSERNFLLAHNLNTIPTFLFAGIALLSFLCYFLILRKKTNIRKTLGVTVLLQIIGFLAYPILETDIFSYMASDRVYTVFHQNVWKVAPVVYKHDPFFQLADWTNLTKIYGGVEQFFYNFASFLGGNSLALNIITYKGLVLIFTFLSVFIVYKIAKEFFPGRESIFIKLLFWNPLFILEIVGAGHNDIVMLFFMLLAYYVYLRKKVLLSSLSLALAVQTKFIGILLFPFLLLDLIRTNKLIESFYFIAGFSGAVLIIFYFMGVNPVTFVERVFYNSGVYWQGLPSLVYKFYQHKTPVFLLGFALTNLILLYYQYKKSLNPILVYCASVFLYLTFFASAYWNWYVLWAFVFIPFIKENALTKAVFALTFTSLMAYPLYWLSLRFDYHNVAWQFVFYAWTEAGGDILFIEVALMPGKGSLILTGQLGDVMKESMQAAMSYIRARGEALGLSPKFFQKIDVHVHVPEGAVPKDGPSAGDAITTAIVSALTKIPVKRTVGMTGEVTLRGRVLEIGGVKEKVIAAHRSGLKTIILPKDNKKDLIDVPKEVLTDLNFIFVSHMDEVLEVALTKPLPKASASAMRPLLHSQLTQAD